MGFLPRSVLCSANTEPAYDIVQYRHSLCDDSKAHIVALVESDTWPETDIYLPRAQSLATDDEQFHRTALPSDTRLVRGRLHASRKSKAIPSYLPHPLLAKSNPSPATGTMSQTFPVNATPSTSSNFQLIFNIAVRAYEKQTKKDLLSHPLACQLQKCDTPTSALAVLQSQVDDLDRARNPTND
jgi:hypothetical protein